jgi:putative ABC transport system ATP-binding protein
MSSVFTLSGLRFRYPKTAHDVLDIEALALAPGETLFLRGPSGSGKSTLLALMSGVLAAQHGALTLLGNRLDQASSARRDRLRAEHIGLVFQQFNLLPYLSLLDNVLLSARFSPARAARARASHGTEAKAARHLLDALGLAQVVDRARVDTLSVGQQQRVAVARALLGSPELLVCDEPTSAIDHDARDAFMQLILTQAALAKSAIVFVSHDPALAQYFQRVLDLREINRAGATPRALAQESV